MPPACRAEPLSFAKRIFRLKAVSFGFMFAEFLIVANRYGGPLQMGRSILSGSQN